MVETSGKFPKVLDVGQCNFDHPRITRLLKENFDARVDRAHGLEDARGLMSKTRYDLVLVNRLLHRDQSPGIDVIRALKGDADLGDVPMMLVSNYPEAQQAAVEIGAVRGFGKDEYDREETVERLAAVLR